MPAVSSSLEKIPQNPPISPALRPETIRHPDKRSKLENDATCGLSRGEAASGELLPVELDELLTLRQALRKELLGRITLTKR